MGNIFTVRDLDRQVSMSNGGTRVFCDVMALAGSATASTAWQQWLTLLFCDSERHCSGCSGVDLADLPWTRDHGAEKEHLLRVLDRAVDRHGWDRLHHDPPRVRDDLLDFRLMVAAFTPQETTGSVMGDWTRPPPAHEVDRCPRHLVFRGEYGCRLCDVSCQPIDAPRVWELVSLRTSGDGRVLHREVAQVPDAVMPALRRRIDPGLLAPAVDDRRPTGIACDEPVVRGHVEAVLGRALDPALEHHLRTAVA